MRHRFRATSIRVILATAAMTAAIAVQAQTTSPAGLVTAYATATDRAGRDVADLRPEEVAIRANGKPVPLVSLSRAPRELAAIVLLDMSASMAEHVQRMNVLASEFVAQLRPPDRAAIGGFSGDVRVGLPLTSNRAELASQLKAIPSGNPSKFFDAMVATTEVLKHEPARRVVFVMSDGDDTASFASFGKALRALHEHDVMVYAVGLESVYKDGSGRTNRSGPNSVLKRLTEETGGGYVTLKDLANATSAITSMFEELRSQYMLTFAPPAPDGKMRSLQVASTRPDVSLRARRRYIASR